MNIFNKYKSHFIATGLSLIVYILFFLALFIKPGSFNPSNSEHDTDIPVQFQLLDEIPLPPPSSNQLTTQEVVKSGASKALASLANDVDKTTQTSEENIQSANRDSMMMTEMKVMMAEIRGIMPVEDSLKEEEVTAQNIQKKISEKVDDYFNDRKFYAENYRLILNLKRVYPYVIQTKQVVDKLNAQLANMTNNQQKRALIKKTEKELFQQFEKDVRNMSYSQGKLLLKLLARETNQSAYGLIKTYKGGIPATFWYTVGLIFHEDLKAKYDSIGEDKQLEKVVKKYQNGRLNQ